MLRIGTIGTGAIATEFVEAVKSRKDCKINVVYSRSIEKGKLFSLKSQLSVHVVDNFDDMLDKMDIVYIASPNGLHYQQAKYFLQNQKNVILEKPLAFTEAEAKDLESVALVNKVILMEAMKPVHTPNFNLIKQEVKNTNYFLANFMWCNYSSRMNNIINEDFYKDSIFDENLGKGTLYDAAVYPVEVAISLFGKVKEVKCLSHKLKNNVDINNLIMLRHANGVLSSITVSKAANSSNICEFLSYDKTLEINNVNSMIDLTIKDRVTKKSKTFNENTEKHIMNYEINTMISMIKNNDFDLMKDYLQNTIETIRVLEGIDKKLGE
ncbi:Gfo/Idh/MocA family oxidoreductase [Spiroplasma endosymbiont of Anurida maritima]|uniref:Gfo/Idh/MocA family protein n=1 Tax=Spiroplasma endosymbiont of Anurida maritima TaxID=2967972 RepID=UPI0036D278C3